MVRGELHLGSLREIVLETPDPEIDYTIKEREVALDKELLQLVQGACKADNLQRALDIARLMHNPATIDAAAKVAGFYHLPGLQERIQRVKGEKEKAKRRLKVKREKEYVGVSTPNGHGNGIPNGNAVAKVGLDFAPRGPGPRRSFGGVQRDSTPAASGRSETYIPETPGLGEGTPGPPILDEEMVREREREGSPVEKRKRVEEEDGVEDFALKKRVEEFPPTNGRLFIELPCQNS